MKKYKHGETALYVSSMEKYFSSKSSVYSDYLVKVKWNKIETFIIFDIKSIIFQNFYVFWQSSAESGATSPLASGPPEYMIGTYKPGDYEYVGVPLDHSQTEEESSGPSTAEIIANQSQDYVDEKLAEYQATIQQLQSE